MTKLVRSRLVVLALWQSQLALRALKLHALNPTDTSWLIFNYYIYDVQRVQNLKLLRAEALCSSGVSRAQEEKWLQEALEKNGYPPTFVQRLRLPQTDREERQTARASATIPYIHGLSQSIRRVLSHLDIRVAFRPFRTLRQELVHPKDPVPELQRKGVVNTIPCDQCPRCHVGQTGRSLEQHLGEHHRALRKGDVLASAVAEHVFTSGHQMDLSKARVMDSHPHTQTRCLLESWHIQRKQALLNREKGTLPGIYTTLLE